MLYSLIVLALISALWLWHPLLARSGRCYALAALATLVLGVSPALLIVAMRQTDLSYTLVAYAQVVSGWLFASIGAAWLLAMLRDGLAALGWVLHAPRLTRWLWRPRTTLAGVALVLLVAALGVTQGLRLPEVREHELPLASLPPELDGLRVGILADLHASPVNDARYVGAVVQRLQAARPDLIVLPGDLVDGKADTQAGNIAPLAELRAPYGIWAAPGNHEYYSGYRAWEQVFADLGLVYLANEAQTQEVRGKRLTISGVGDPAFHQSNHAGDGVAPDIERVVQQARQQQSDFHILLGHQPKMARQYAAQGGIDLQLAGHTHGGHIRGMDQWLVARFNDGFVRGRYDIGDMTLFISNGAGLWAGFTLRLGVPAAIDILTLRSAK